MPAHSALQEILTLDPERDHLRIVYLVSFQEFPWDTTRSLEVALMRTFAGPLTSAILAQTGELTQRPPKRYDDTDLILSEILEHGYDSERCCRPMVEQEQLMIFHYWREIGRRMNIKDIPSDFAAFERYNVQFEREHFAYSKDTAAAATRTRDMFLGWFLPKFLYPVGAPFLHALLDDSLLEAFGFP